MDSNEIFEYITKGMKWLAISGAFGYMGIISSDSIVSLFSERIRDQSKLDRVVAEESEKLGLRGIRGRYKERNAGSAYFQYGVPTIEVGGFGSTRAGIRHELYHLYKGDCVRAISIKDGKKWKNSIKYLFLEEPRACLYGAFRIKI